MTNPLGKTSPKKVGEVSLLLDLSSWLLLPYNEKVNENGGTETPVFFFCLFVFNKHSSVERAVLSGLAGWEKGRFC